MVNEPKRSMLLGMLLLAGLALSACASGPGSRGGAPQGGDADFQGHLFEAVRLDNGDVIGMLRVEMKVMTAEGTKEERYVVTVTKGTHVYAQSGTEFRRIDFDNLVEGSLLQVWFDGPVAESWPMQVRAGQIVVAPLGRPSS